MSSSIPLIGEAKHGDISYRTGDSLVWRYCSWANVVIATFAIAMVAMYMVKTAKPYAMALVPGTFYVFVVMSYILSAQIGFNLPMPAAHALAGACCCAFVAFMVRAQFTRERDRDKSMPRSGLLDDERTPKVRDRDPHEAP